MNSYLVPSCLVKWLYFGVAVESGRRAAPFAPPQGTVTVRRMLECTLQRKGRLSALLAVGLREDVSWMRERAAPLQEV